MEDISQHAKTRVPGGKVLLVAMLHPNSYFYSVIKRLGELRHGVISQCMDFGKATRQGNKLEGYLDNLCLKINVKLGGLNYALVPRNENENPLMYKERMPSPAGSGNPNTMVQRNITLNNHNPHSPYSTITPLTVFGIAFQRDRTESFGSLAVVNTYDHT
eukprot:UN07854